MIALERLLMLHNKNPYPKKCDKIANVLKKDKATSLFKT